MTSPKSLGPAALCCFPRRWGSGRHWGTVSEGAVPVAGVFPASPGGMASLLPPEGEGRAEASRDSVCLELRLCSHHRGVG